MAVPYTFATATSAIPLSQLDSNFATAITIGSTATYLGNTTTTIAGLTLTSPTLTTPALGTPASGVLTNCTGYPSSAISGTISLTTQVTGTLPVLNGGTGVTTSTGSGNVVLSTSPTFVTPLLGTPTSGTLTNCTVDGTDSVGFRNIPQNAQTGSYTLVLADSGKHIYHASGAGAATYTIPAASSVAYPIGTAITFINLSATSISIAITTDTMYLSSAGTTGTRTLAQYGSATAIKVSGVSSSGIWVISGSALT